MVKVAVSTDSGNVATHFGHCPHYTVADIVDGQLKHRQVIPNPGHKPLSAEILGKGYSVYCGRRNGTKGGRLVQRERIQPSQAQWWWKKRWQNWLRTLSATTALAITIPKER